MAKYMLTTFDNPYNPFTEFGSWLQYDVMKGYNTCDRLARVADVTDNLSDEDADELIEQAMNDLVSADILNIFRKVTEDDFKEQNEYVQELKQSIEAREMEPKDEKEESEQSIETETQEKDEASKSSESEQSMEKAKEDEKKLKNPDNS